MPHVGAVAAGAGRGHDPLHRPVRRAARKRRVRVAADCLCQDLTRKLTRRRPSDRYFRTVTKLGEAIANGEFKSIAGLPEAEILMPYKKD